MKVVVSGLVLLTLAILVFFSYQSSQSEVEAEAEGSIAPVEVSEKMKEKQSTSENNRNDEVDSDWEGLDKEKAREVMRDEGMPVGASSYTGPRPLTEKEMDKMDEIFEAYEKGWDDEMKSMMIGEIGLSEEDYGDYLKMRDGFEEDRLEAFEEFHKKMAMEKGPHYSYSPTQEMIDFDKKLKDEYLDLFRKRYGEEAYARYQNALDKYNTKIRSEADPKFGVLTIEF
jgi:hypothetical protein